MKHGYLGKLKGRGGRFMSKLYKGQKKNYGLAKIFKQIDDENIPKNDSGGRNPASRLHHPRRDGKDLQERRL